MCAHAGLVGDFSDIFVWLRGNEALSPPMVLPLMCSNTTALAHALALNKHMRKYNTRINVEFYGVRVHILEAPEREFMASKSKDLFSW